MVEKTETTRGLDTTAVLLLSALGVLAALVGATLIYFGYFAPWEFGCLCASPLWRVGPYFLARSSRTYPEVTRQISIHVKVA
jgi:hypothetical protein